MASYNPQTTQWKRKRRRRVERPPLFGWLELGEEPKGNAGLISAGLLNEIGGVEAEGFENGADEPVQRFVAISPWTPRRVLTVEEKRWTIVPVKLSSGKQSSDTSKDHTIRLNPSCLAIQSLANGLQANSFARNTPSKQARFETDILSTQPVHLQSIYVAIDGEALKKHDEVQRKFGGGFLNPNASHNASGRKAAKNAANAKTDLTLQEDVLIAVIRDALQSAIVARKGDYIPLPLPAHPITHVPFPPALIVLCEPVQQGIPTQDTRIIVNRIGSKGPNSHSTSNGPLPILSSSKSLTDFDATDGDGTSNEAYHSALEDGDTSEQSLEEGPASNSDDSDKDTSSSEDSDDDLIAMNPPSLTLRHNTTLSSRASMTPRGYQHKGGVSTPGSVFSTMTSATIRRNEAQLGKLLKVQELLLKVPEELLQPVPPTDEDEECRIFVDIKILVRIGVFSGDWVSIEAEHANKEANPLLPASFDSRISSRRPAKIYGLQDMQSTVVRRSAGRMPQAANGVPLNTPSVWISPILSANLHRPRAMRVMPLYDPAADANARPRSGRRKVDNTAAPSLAQEMVFTRIASPMSTERAVQAGLFRTLKRHFEDKRRIVKEGDLIAIPLDVQACRLLGQIGQDDDIDGLLESSDEQTSNSNISDVAWFKVSSVTGAEPMEAADLAPGIWDSAMRIDPEYTRMRQAGSETAKLPPQAESTWAFYCGVRTVQYRPWSSWAQVLSQNMPRQYISPTRQRLRELFATSVSPRALHLDMGPVVILLHSNQRSIGKATVAKRAAADLGLHVFGIDAYELLAEGVSGADVKTEALFKARVERALSCGPQSTAVLVRHLEALNSERLVAAFKEMVPLMKILVATTSELDKVPDGLRGVFTHEVEIAAPDEYEREGLLRDILSERNVPVAGDLELSSVALKTAALVAGNLVDVVDRAQTARIDRLKRLLEHGRETTIRDLLVAGGDSIRSVTKCDFESAVEAARKNFADAIGAPKIPNVTWDDVGGLGQVKDAVVETIQLPLERPELFAKGMKKRSGILFYGPPGTGKTLLAKAIATEFSLNFFSVKGPELLNMYIGESEANVRRVFQRARDARPCVVFFDELDSVAPKRGNQGDSGGVMDRIVSQLLAELDGMSDGAEGSGGVFVIGATNRPDLLDQALIRPGRFDKMLYLGVSDTHERQMAILEALTRKFVMDSQLDLIRVAGGLPFTYTGADLYALCSDAMLKAITRQAAAVDEKISTLNQEKGKVTPAYIFDHLATEEDTEVIVTEEDFKAAQRDLVPSVSAQELEHYQRVRREFEGTGTKPTTSNATALVNGHHDNEDEGRGPVQRSNTMIYMPEQPKQLSHVSKGKKNANGNKKRKGKGKGVSKASDDDDKDDDEEDEEEAYVTSND